MGYGAYMNIVNQRKSSIRTFITHVECMYDQGQEGSNLSLFNNITITEGSSLPGGHGQYIEAKGSGGCWFADSKFRVKIEDADNKIIGVVDFDDVNKNWNYVNSNEGVIDVYVNNSGSQAIIKITVEAPPPTIKSQQDGAGSV